MYNTKEISERIIPLMEKIISNPSIRVNSESPDRSFEFINTLITDQSKELSVLLNFNDEQTILVTLVAWHTVNDKGCTAKTLCEYLSLSLFTTPLLEKKLAKLANEKHLLKNKHDGVYIYSVPGNLLGIFSELDVEKIHSLPDVLQMEKLLTVLFTELNECIISIEDAIKFIKQLFKKFPEQPLLAWITEFNLSNREECYFFYIINASSGGINSVDLDYWIKKHFSETADRISLRTKYYDDSSLFYKNNTFYLTEANIFDVQEIVLTKSTINKLYNTGLVISNLEKRSNLFTYVDFETITKKELYYNHKEKDQVRLLTDSLMPESYLKLQKGFVENKLALGFLVLLYGEPGTGKTETANQIAINTKRDIMIVDISKIRNKYVGDSEKAIKNVFKEYQRICKLSVQAPILLFNESDALINKRMNVASSTDQMNNSMQNILLQELESFEGILIATTNMIRNLDKAFERRFLWKIKFQVPELAVRIDLLNMRFNNVKREELIKFAERFPLTGAQIENLYKKVMIVNSLGTSENQAELMEEFAKQEIFSMENNKTKIGYLD
ncbi:MAG: ATP-binding protein [Bacteroidetes bacterium]|nr:ATP-binding protein [Bacteroidota bacterium]